MKYRIVKRIQRGEATLDPGEVVDGTKLAGDVDWLLRKGAIVKVATKKKAGD